MNATFDHEREDLRHAEYALGVLDADVRAMVMREVLADTRAATEVAWWQTQFAPLTEDIAPAAAPDYVWARILDALGLQTPRAMREPARGSFWDSLVLWRILGIGASAVAAACVIALLIQPRTPVAPPAAQVHYLAATIMQNNGVPGWTVTLDTAHARAVIVPAAPNAIATNRAPELWLIPAGGKPIAVGVFARDKATAIALTPQLAALWNARALLAVSVEPPGGSPTGQPTGPVVGKGALGGA